MSRFHIGQFRGLKSDVSVCYQTTICAIAQSILFFFYCMSPTYSFGSSLGCGDSKYSPVLSYFRFGSRSAGSVTLCAWSSRIVTVPAMGDSWSVSCC